MAWPACRDEGMTFMQSGSFLRCHTEKSQQALLMRDSLPIDSHVFRFKNDFLARNGSEHVQTRQGPNRAKKAVRDETGIDDERHGTNGGFMRNVNLALPAPHGPAATNRQNAGDGTGTDAAGPDHGDSGPQGRTPNGSQGFVPRMNLDRSEGLIRTCRQIYSLWRTRLAKSIDNDRPTRMRSGDRSEMGARAMAIVAIWAVRQNESFKYNKSVFQLAEKNHQSRG